MNKYEKYKQELIRQVAYKEIDAFGLVDYVIELCEKIDRQDKVIELLKKRVKK